MTVSVVIPTKNRAKLLNLCLTSLVNQTTLPNEVIIIDNNSTDQSALIIKEFEKKLSIIHHISNNDSLPSLYNSGIKIASSNIIACLDDDCWVDRNWVKNIIHIHKKNPRTVVQGRVICYPKKNIYVDIMSKHYQNWLQSHIVGDHLLSVLDTKNVSFPKKIIKNNLFLESLNKGSHDIELGKRLFNKHIKIIFDENIIAWHKERTTLKGFITQHWRIAQSEALLKSSSKGGDIKVVFSRKNFWSLVDMAKMIAENIFKLNVFMTIYIPFLYLVLLIIRITGFFYISIRPHKTLC
jgi:glycosyltransferase involved in cell wall biosynthesis